MAGKASSKKLKPILIGLVGALVAFSGFRLYNIFLSEVIADFGASFGLSEPVTLLLLIVLGSGVLYWLGSSGLSRIMK